MFKFRERETGDPAAHHELFFLLRRPTAPARATTTAPHLPSRCRATARIRLLRSDPPALPPAPSRLSSPPRLPRRLASHRRPASLRRSWLPGSFSVVGYAREEGEGAAARGSRGSGVHPA